MDVRRCTGADMEVAAHILVVDTEDMVGTAAIGRYASRVASRPALHPVSPMRQCATLRKEAMVGVAVQIMAVATGDMVDTEATEGTVVIVLPDKRFRVLFNEGASTFNCMLTLFASGLNLKKTYPKCSTPGTGLCPSIFSDQPLFEL